MRDEHYTSFMHLYYSTLSPTIQKLGSDPEQLFSWNDFQAQLKKLGVYAMAISPIIIQVRYATADDCNDLEEVSGGDGAEELDYTNGLTEANQNIYTDIVNDLVNGLVEIGYLT